MGELHSYVRMLLVGSASETAVQDNTKEYLMDELVSNLLRVRRFCVAAVVGFSLGALSVYFMGQRTVGIGAAMATLLISFIIGNIYGRCGGYVLGRYDERKTKGACREDL
jgi:hypothetical protein